MIEPEAKENEWNSTGTEMLCPPVLFHGRMYAHR